MDIPVDPAHRLAIPAWGFKMLEAPMRNPEWVTVYYWEGGVRKSRQENIYDKTLNLHLGEAVDIPNYIQRMNVLLHL